MGADKYEKRKHNRLPPFVPLLNDTIDSPAWRAMSHGARVLYIALRRRYSQNAHNNGRVFLSQRHAKHELGSNRTYIARWYRELQHYGFIVQTTPGCLGVDGKGRAPHWRLTELGHFKEPPTRDFIRWDRTKFRAREKQNPGPQKWSSPDHKSGPPLDHKSGPPKRKSGPQKWSIRGGSGGPQKWSITRRPSLADAPAPAADAPGGPDRAAPAPDADRWPDVIYDLPMFLKPRRPQ
jgi:hypothetical protein